MTFLHALVLVRALEALASSAMLPFLVLWAHRDAGLGGAAAGALFVGQAVGEFVGGVAGGGLADRHGRRRVLMLSTLGMALTYGLLGFVGSPLTAVALFLAAGVVESAFHPTVGALVAEAVPDERLLDAFSLLRVGAHAGRIVGPLLGAAAAMAGLWLVFAVSGTLLLVAVVVEGMTIPRRLDVAHASQEGESPVPAGTLLVLRSDRTLAVLVLTGGLLASTVSWWQADGLVLLRQQTPLGTGAYAALFAIAAMTVLVGQLPVTRLLRGVPAGRALLAGALLQAAGLGVLVGAHGGYAVLVAAVVLLSLGETAYAPTISTLVTRRARVGQRASYQAALAVTEDIGTAVGPISGLALARVTTSVGLWLTGALLCAAGGLASSHAARRGLASPDPAPGPAPRRG